ncbi:hypothetical protein BST61_g6802 [Cercospora zeina]
MASYLAPPLHTGNIEGDDMLFTLRGVATSFNLQRIRGPNIEYDIMKGIIEYSAWIYHGRGIMKMAKALRDTLWRRKLCGAEEDTWFRVTLERWLMHGAGGENGIGKEDWERLRLAMDELYALTA